MKDVEVFDSEARAGTFLIAQGFSREHKKILELIRKYEDKFTNFGPLKGRKLRSTGGRAANEIMLDEDQFMFLGSLLRNSDITVEFKFRIINQFKKTRKQLEAVQKTHTKPEYQLTRDAGVIVRKQTTDTMRRFVEYGINQGGSVSGCEMYYSNITRMMNSLLFIVEGKYKNLKEVMTIQQLMTVSSAEQIIDRGLLDGMSRKKYFKDIYQDVKSKVKQFAELHGKSDVIEMQIELMEN